MISPTRSSTGGRPHAGQGSLGYARVPQPLQGVSGDGRRSSISLVLPWNERSLADAVRRQARHEETTRWDVVEFKLD